MKTFTSREFFVIYSLVRRMFRFRKAGSPSASPAVPLNNLDGTEAKKQYEEIINSPKKRRVRVQRPSRKLCVRTEPKREPFDEKKFFFAATNGDFCSLRCMTIPPESINAADRFGWTALMMASCSNHVEIVRFLCESGADRSLRNNKGLSARDVAASKGHQKVVDFLDNYDPDPVIVLSDSGDAETDDEGEKDKTHCDVCNREIPEGDMKRHLVSTLHRFNQKDAHKFPRRFGIPESNVGFRLMVRQGWNRENGLGSQQEGPLYPVKTVLRKFRSGLGVKQAAKARVTHFQPFDRNAVKGHRPPQPPATIKKQMRRLQARERRKEIRFRKLLSSD